MIPKVTLVFGGSGGVGTAITKALVHHDMHVYATYTHNKEKAEQLERYKNCTILQCDFTSIESIRNAIYTVLNKETGIDIIINTVTAPLKLKLFEQLSEEQIREDIDVILTGSALAYKYLIPILKERPDPLIITILSAAIQGVPPARMTSYTAAKYGLRGLTKSLATELTNSIRFVDIAPSIIETDLIKAFPSKLLELEQSKCPGQRFIQPEDIAVLIQKVIEDKQTYPTGSYIVPH